MTVLFLLFFMPADKPLAPSALPPERIWIEMTEEPGLDDHALIIRIDGTGAVRVTRRMNDSQEVTEISRRKVEPREVEKLLNQFHEGRFFEMPGELAFTQSRIALNPDGTYRELLFAAMDGVCMRLTVVIGDKRKDVRECNADWKPLQELYKLMYDIAELQKWKER